MEHYECVIDIKNRQLITKYRTIPLYRVSEDLLPNSSIKNQTSNQNNSQNFQNIINIEPRTEQIFKLKCNFKNTEAILHAQVKEKVRLPNALVKINEKGEFYTTIVNINAIQKTINFSDIILEPIQNYSINNFKPFENQNFNREEIIQNQLRLDHLNSEEKELITETCLEFSDIFYLDGDSLTFTNEIKHKIELSNPKPIVTKSYRYPHVHKEEVKSQVSKMLQQGIIQPSTSPFSSPVWVVPKKLDASGKQKWRIVIDYRKLNEVTVDDKYPLPNISDLLDQLGKCQYFTTLDLASGFHQIEIDKKDIEKTAFSVENGHYEFIRMPFGLKNAPATFQRVMDNVLLGIQNERALVYMDDILIYSPTIYEHINRLKEVFTRLRNSNLKIQPDKCEFLRKEVAYLGHIITKDGVKPNPQKCQAIKDFPEPRNPKEIKSFLGLTGYYRRFIPNFAKIAKPLTKLLQKDIPFHFNKECSESFEKLKNFLMTEPILIYPNFEETFILTTDASAFAIGAILSQGPINKDLPIAYASRTLCSSEIKMSVIERELLAIIWAVKHFRPYLYGRKFKLVTDHRPLTWLFSIKDPGSRLARWRLKLEEYDYEIIYKPGKINKNADALSRIRINHFKECSKLSSKIYASNQNSPSHSNSDTDTADEQEITPDEIIHEFLNFVELYKTTSLIDYSKIEYTNAQLLDKTHKDIISILWQNHTTDLHEKILEDILETELDVNFNKINILHSYSVKNRTYYLILVPFNPDEVNEYLFNALYKYKNELDPTKIYCVENNPDLPTLEMLCYIFSGKEIKFQVCQNIVQTPTKDEIPIILDQFHTGKRNLHRGVNETIRRIKEKYNWTGLTKDVENFIKGCETCQKTKICRKNLSSPLVVTETPKTAFERINLDILEVPTKNYILVIRDELTKFTQAYPLSNKTAQSVVNTLLLYFQHYGTPIRIHCDSGREFNNTVFKDLCTLYDIKISFSSIGHPQSNGSVERFNATLLEIIRAHLSDNPNEHPLNCLPYAVICYNNSKNATHGFTPYELIFGHTSGRPPETLYNEKQIISKYIRDLNNRIKYFYELARQRTQEAKQKSKDRHDKTISEKQYEFKIGDKVYVKESQIGNKLQNKFNGPYEILEIFQNSANLLNLQTGFQTKINFDRMKPYTET